MPNLKSALKRMRSDKKRRARNQAVISDIKTRIRKFDLLASQKNPNELNTSLKNIVSKINKAASKGIIHKNKASRLISRICKRLSKSSAA